jgi:hypothetical protein
MAIEIREAPCSESQKKHPQGAAFFLKKTPLHLITRGKTKLEVANLT